LAPDRKGTHMIGTHLKSAREAAGVSQHKLARILGVTPQAISGWESGRSNPHTDRIPKLARILGCSVNRLLTGDDDGAPPELLAVWDALATPEMRAYALVLLRGLVGKAGRPNRANGLPNASVWESWD
jgi:transcriptional regulator with XRE-family HTH domain